MLTLMQSLALKLIVLATRRLVSRGLFDRALALAHAAAVRLAAPGTGAEKKAWVIDRLSSEAGWLGEEAKTLPSWLLSMVVDVVVAQMKARAA